MTRALILVMLVTGCERAPTSSDPPDDHRPPGPQPIEPTKRRSPRDQVLELNGHALVLKSSAMFTEYRDVIDTARKTTGVTSAVPVVYEEMYVTKARAMLGLTIFVKGVELHEGARRLAPFVVEGSFGASQPRPIAIGNALAKNLRVGVGDDITLTYANATTFDQTSGTTVPMDPLPSATFRVRAIFYTGTGVDDYNEKLAYVELAAVQQLIGRGDTVTGIELRVQDIEQAAAIAERLENALGGPPYETRDWRTLSPSL